MALDLTDYGMPQIWTYGDYASKNYGAHCLVVRFGPLTVWYSYETPVAFSHPDMGKFVHQNDWGPTTGKHLRWIDGNSKKSRVSAEEFDEKFQEALRLMAGKTPKPLQVQGMTERKLRVA